MSARPAASLAPTNRTSTFVDLLERAFLDQRQERSRSYEPATRGVQVQVLRAQVSADRELQRAHDITTCPAVVTTSLSAGNAPTSFSAASSTFS